MPFYGFPYGKGFAGQHAPIEYVKQLDAPMLMIHGSRDQASSIQDIYKYATALDAEGKYFELKVYQGEPHGFMIDKDGQLSQSYPAADAFWQMVCGLGGRLPEQDHFDLPQQNQSAENLIFADICE